MALLGLTTRTRKEKTLVDSVTKHERISVIQENETTESVTEEFLCAVTNRIRRLFPTVSDLDYVTGGTGSLSRLVGWG